jgi:transcription antitermination factor NusA-like protein
VVTDLANRYGAPSSRRRRVVGAAVTGVAALALAWLAWAALSHADPAVTSDIVSWEVVDDHTATATFRVSRRTADVEASCLLRAQARDHSIVGELNVAVGPGGERTQAVTETLRTERLATVVDVVGCVADGQNRRR